MAEFCEYCSEPSGSLKVGNLFIAEKLLGYVGRFQGTQSLITTRERVVLASRNGESESGSSQSDIFLFPPHQKRGKNYALRRHFSGPQSTGGAKTVPLCRLRWSL
jgi:hypothetical protein